MWLTSGCCPASEEGTVPQTVSWEKLKTQTPGGRVVRIQHFHCCRLGSTPGQELRSHIEPLHAKAKRQKKKKKPKPNQNLSTSQVQIILNIYCFHTIVKLKNLKQSHHRQGTIHDFRHPLAILEQIPSR